MNQQQTGHDRAQDIFRTLVLAAGYDLRGDLSALTRKSDGESLAYEATTWGLDWLAEDLRSVADRAVQVGEAAITALDLAEAARTWLVSGCAHRCLNCGRHIDVAADEWRICRGHAEHTWCHEKGLSDQGEDRARGCTVVEDELAAYCLDREHTGGPVHGDQVEAVLADGRTVEGTWYVPGPPPLAGALVLDFADDEITVGDDTRVRVTDVAADLGEVWVNTLDEELGCLAAVLRTAAAWGLHLGTVHAQDEIGTEAGHRD